jgi:hypothetical protein
MIGFINKLQVVTTLLRISTLYKSLHTNLLSLFPLVFIIRFLAADL